MAKPRVPGRRRSAARIVPRLALGLWLGLAPASLGEGAGLGQPAPHLRLAEGTARLLEGRLVRALERGSGVRLEGALGRVECGARSRLELAWRGQASATVSGPATLELGQEPRLVLEAFQAAEVEVRRGTFVVELAGLGSLELAAGAARLARLPDGTCELENRGGRALTFWLAEAHPLLIGPGRSLRIRPAGGD